MRFPVRPSIVVTTTGKLTSLSLAVIFFSALAAGQAPAAPCGPAEGDAAQLARYAYELAQNRAAKCQAGGNFIADPQAKLLRLSVPEYCAEVGVPPRRHAAVSAAHPTSLPVQDKGGGVTDVKATYSYIQCPGAPGAGKETSLELAFRVMKCAASDSALAQPFKLTAVRAEIIPSNCETQSGPNLVPELPLTTAPPLPQSPAPPARPLSRATSEKRTSPRSGSLRTWLRMRSSIT